MRDPDYVSEVRKATDAIMAAAVAHGGRGESEEWAAKALEYLQLARAAAKNAGSRNTLKRIDHAISSAKGAVRAGRYRDMRRAGR